MTNPQDYGDSINQSIVKTDIEFSNINKKISEHTLNDKELAAANLSKEALDAEGKYLTRDEAYDKAAKEAKLNDKEFIQWNEDLKIAKIIERYLSQELVSSDIVHKPMTPTEAREYVKSLADMTLEGQPLTSRNVHELLRKHRD